MLLIFPVFDRIELLPYFLRYYSSLGASRFVCGLFNGRMNPLYAKILSYSPAYDLSIETSIIPDPPQPYYCEETATRGLNRIREQFTGQFPWYCVADLDEFHYFGGRTLQDVADEAEQSGYDAVHGTFFDRIAPDGSFPALRDSLDETFPLACDLSHCSGLSRNKITLAKSHIVIAPGHHNALGRVWYNVTEVHHFKWHSGVQEYVNDALAGFSRQNLRWAKRDLPRLLKLIENGLDLDDPRLRVRPAARLGI